MPTTLNMKSAKFRLKQSDVIGCDCTDSDSHTVTRWILLPRWAALLLILLCLRHQGLAYGLTLCGCGSKTIVSKNPHHRGLHEREPYYCVCEPMKKRIKLILPNSRMSINAGPTPVTLGSK